MSNDPDREPTPAEYVYTGMILERGYGLVFAILDLIQPRLKLEDGCVMPAHETANNLKNWVDTMKGDRTAAEAMINHVHIADLLAADVGQRLDDHPRLIHLAEVYAALLETEVKRVAPGRPYRVEISGIEESKTDPEMLEVTAWLERPK